MRAEAITAALGGRWHGSYGNACCPAHDDSTPSLSISEGKDGKIRPQAPESTESRRFLPTALRCWHMRLAARSISRSAMAASMTSCPENCGA